MFHVTPICINVVFVGITALCTMRSQWVLARTDKGQMYRTNRVGTKKTQQHSTTTNIQDQQGRHNTNNKTQQQIYWTNREGITTTKHNTTTIIQDQQDRYNNNSNIKITTKQKQQIHDKYRTNRIVFRTNCEGSTTSEKAQQIYHTNRDGTTTLRS